MVSDGQNWEMGAGELRRNRELKPFWGQTFLIGKDRTDSETVKNNLEIRQTDKPSLLSPHLTREQGSGEFSLAFTLLVRYVHSDPLEEWGEAGEENF